MDYPKKARKNLLACIKTAKRLSKSNFKDIKETKDQIF